MGVVPVAAAAEAEEEENVMFNFVSLSDADSIFDLSLTWSHNASLSTFSDTRRCLVNGCTSFCMDSSCSNVMCI